MRIIPEKVRYVSRMKEICKECPLHQQILESDDNEYFEIVN